MRKKAPQDWEILEQELYSAGVEPAEVEAGARRLPAKPVVINSPRRASSTGWPRGTWLPA
ncbi:hypothetical protein [Streptomyces albicerus]|uniref:hypothetical protein n=1 Tax=Streptomyces albicerus TaxID=2569859 RepID=UPI001CEDE87A|nr:hypothetical protein [Streptomyces albicerus]